MLRALSPWLLAAALVLPAGAAERVSDAAYGQALFDFYRKDYFGAIVGIEAALSRERLPREAPYVGVADADDLQKC